MKQKQIRYAVLLSMVAALPLLTACAESKETPAAESSEAAAETSAAENNDHSEIDAPFDAEGMHFSVKSGFYDTAFHLSVTAAEGTEIYYTLDGSTPDTGSIRYTEPILIADRSPDENKLSIVNSSNSNR